MPQADEPTIAEYVERYRRCRPGFGSGWVPCAERVFLYIRRYSWDYWVVRIDTNRAPLRRTEGEAETIDEAVACALLLLTEA